MTQEELHAYQAKKAAAGRLGGKATFAKHGSEHMARIGKLGFAALARRLGYAGGSRRGAIRFLMGTRGLVPRHPHVDLTPDQERALCASVGLDSSWQSE